ncbi:hypothetical protein DXC31_02645 [Mediterraneibacter gnavus]|uniref:Uncharacterized protein n=1 Tax=Mediterraneibacter gnavus TaxID=33038 RepID=A0A3E4VCH9_MEDGN|nr:hypothetical protein DXC31_02645 [Mediterraneibacter gnavus]
MKKFEIHISASYISGGVEYWNAFTEYVEAANKTEAKKNLRAELREDGYKKIEMDALLVA